MVNITPNTPCHPPAPPDAAFLRHIGLVLLGLTVMSGVISVVGILEVRAPVIMAQSAGSAAPADNSLLQQMERNIFQWEMLQAHYVNPKSI